MGGGALARTTEAAGGGRAPEGRLRGPERGEVCGCGHRGANFHLRQMDSALRTDVGCEDQGPSSGGVIIPAAAATLLRHFPEEVRAAYVQLKETGDPAAADTLVLAIVKDHMPQKDAEFGDRAALIADLGFDSVAIAEMVFFIEDLLQVSVTNAEIMQVRTVGELRAFVRTKLARAASGARPASEA
jgi:acyl carrier protein